MKRFPTYLTSLILLVVLATTAQADVCIETVPVGNLGNAANMRYNLDMRPEGFGTVDYAYNIGKYEVTTGQYCEFLNAVAVFDVYKLYNTDMSYGSSGWGCRIKRSGTSGNYSYSVATDYTNRPVNFVSWGDAARFCNWLHNGQPTGILTGDPVQDADLTENGSYDLNGAISDAALLSIIRKNVSTWVIPTEDEWYKAAYHKSDDDTDSYFDEPTSSDTVLSYIDDSGNLSGTGTAFIEGGTDPGNSATFNGDFGIPGIGNPYYRTIVGEHENSASPYGTFDQGGNVYEWNEAIFCNSRRGMRGGSFHEGGGGGMQAWNRTSSTRPSAEGSDLGFRVVQVPEPSTITLLLFGLTSILCLRRRK